MFDALHAGCIPIILSHDFVWPFTTEFDLTEDSTLSSLPLKPADFSIRLQAQDYQEASHNASCQLVRFPTIPHHPRKRLSRILSKAVPPAEIERLRNGALQAGVLPDGGGAHALVQALTERALGQLWPACRDELARGSAKPEEPDATRFQC